MGSRRQGTILGQIRALFHAGAAGGLTDGQLLERFVARRAESAEAATSAEAAFSALVDRHGPMVWGVCRRALGDVHEAEDAFQATFLLLVRKAGSIRVDDSLGRWLYGVACKVAARARSDAERRRPSIVIEPTTSPSDPVEQSVLADLRAVLVEELGHLPAKYRAPVELCHLQGMTHDEAARQLGWPVGTVRSRLSGGRSRLRSRLGRRGLAPSATLLASALDGEARASLSHNLVRSTIRIVMSPASDRAELISASVAVLAEGVSSAMILAKLKPAGAVVLAAGLVAATAGVVAGQGAGEKTPPEAAAKVAEAAPTPSKPDASPPASRDEDIRKALHAARQSAEAVNSPNSRAALLGYVASEFARAGDRETAKATYRLAFRSLLDNPPGPNPKATVAGEYEKALMTLAQRQGSDGFIDEAIEITKAIESKGQQAFVICYISRDMANKGDAEGARRIVGNLDEDYRRGALDDINYLLAQQASNLARAGDLAAARRIAGGLEGEAKRKALVYIASLQAQSDLAAAKTSVESIEDPITRSQAWIGIASTLSGRPPTPLPSFYKPRTGHPSIQDNPSGK